MTLIQLILILVVIGVAWFLVEKYIPMPPLIWTIIRIIVVLAIVIMLLEAVGINTGMRHLRIS